jgi:hypothetical protein
VLIVQCWQRADFVGMEWRKGYLLERRQLSQYAEGSGWSESISMIRSVIRICLRSWIVTTNEWLRFNAVVRPFWKMGRDNEPATARTAEKSREFVKSRSYRSQGGDGDHGDDDEEAWELWEGSGRGWKKRRLLVLRKAEEKVCRTVPSQTSSSERAAAAAAGPRQGAIQFEWLLRT